MDRWSMWLWNWNHLQLGKQSSLRADADCLRWPGTYSYRYCVPYNPKSRWKVLRFAIGPLLFNNSFPRCGSIQKLLLGRLFNEDISPNNIGHCFVRSWLSILCGRHWIRQVRSPNVPDFYISECDAYFRICAPAVGPACDLSANKQPCECRRTEFKPVVRACQLPLNYREYVFHSHDLQLQTRKGDFPLVLSNN